MQMQQPSGFGHLQAEGLCLRYPENVGLHQTVTADSAFSMLMRAIGLAAVSPFSWSFLDKPNEGQVYLLFLPPGSVFPKDGIRWQEAETKFNANVKGQDLEIHEVKFGFIPGNDQTSWRCRRRYRLLSGGIPGLQLVHYTRGPQGPINPSYMNVPVRSYPLPTMAPDAPTGAFIAGEKVGQKVYANGAGPQQGQGMQPGMPGMPGGMPMQQGGMGMGMAGMGRGAPMSQQAAMLAQQNNTMDSIHRRGEREREVQRAAARAGGGGMPPPVRDEDDSGDENDRISSRSLASTRYRRNHELMNEVFKHAAYGDKYSVPVPSQYAVFNKTELDNKAAKLEAEIKELEIQAAARKLQRASLAALESSKAVSRESSVSTGVAV